jgi:hypothetical protein
MDPIGFGLENFDAVGRYRTTEARKRIDAGGKVIGAGVDEAFDGPVELAKLLARSPVVAGCAVDQVYRYAHGREARADGVDRCAIEGLRRRFAASGGNVRDLLVGVTTADGFLHRAP